ncbi:MAG: CsgG/HfaB family protein [Kiritimatiellae bacterium]|nr:CsgG/HfaB family protein [Kiritimatiellia bacterium]
MSGRRHRAGQALLLLLWAGWMVGCSSFVEQRQVSPRPDYGSGKRFKPVVAVSAFENKSGFSGQWDLGSGMADILTTELLDSDQYVVLERQQLDSVLGEIIRQGQEFFRREGRVNQGRLKNVRYLISGAITDFTVTGDTSGWFGYSTTVKAGGGTSRARVSLHLRLTDVESGEVISSVEASGTASAGWFSAAVSYKNLSLGGDSFFKTPLGKATTRATHRAVKQLAAAIPKEYWHPRVAEAGPDMAVINGGENVGVRVGDDFVVREQGRDITDPVTGDVIERLPGRVIGKIRVDDVQALSAHAVIIEGTTYRGAHLEASR